MNKKAEFYNDIAEVLMADAKDDLENKTGNCHILMSAATNVDVGAYVNIHVKGNDHQLYQLFSATICSKPAPDDLKKSLLLAVAKMLADFDDLNAKMISKGLCLFTERKFGLMECECEKCKARRN